MRLTHTPLVALLLLPALLSACGGGRPVTPIDTPPGTITAMVFAGAPVTGATVEAWAVDTETAEPITSRPDKGLLGTSDPSDSTGKADIKLGTSFNGLVRLVATRGTYINPVAPSDPPQTLPATLQLTTFITNYKHGTSMTRPVTLWTTLADAASLAYAAGRNPYSPTSQNVPNALAAIDPLFAKHLDPNPSWSIRTVVPTSFDQPHSLDVTVYAGLGDLALNALAQRIGPGLSAGTVASNLVADLTAEGQFDGIDANSKYLTIGSYKLNTETTRGEMAHALDAFAQASANPTSLKRDVLKANHVYDAISQDASLLYPSDVPPPPFDLDGKPGAVNVTVWAGGPVQGATIQVYAVSSTSGQPLTDRPDNGLLGTSTTPTDTAGHAMVAITSQTPYTGTLQVVALAGTYLDPTDLTTQITLPTDFRMTSYATGYSHGASPQVIITLWTTLADAAGQAYALGYNPTHLTPTSLEAALSFTDNLMARHFEKDATWNLRSTIPGALIDPLAATSYAAMPEIALNKLAHTIAGSGQIDDVSAPTITALLVADLAPDGQFDGKGTSGSKIAVPSQVACDICAFDADTTRADLARALDAYVQHPINKSNVKRAQLLAAGVYDKIALDETALYPISSPPPKPFDLASTPPQLVLKSPTTSPLWLKATELDIVVEAFDNSGTGIKEVKARLGSTITTITTHDGTLYTFHATGLAIGQRTVITLWAIDNLENSGEETEYVTVTIDQDQTTPTISITPNSPYKSEQGLELASPNPPPTYNYTRPVAEDQIPANAACTLYKATTRLSYGPACTTQASCSASQPCVNGACAPSVADLITQQNNLLVTSKNPYNTPFITFEIPYNSGTDSPLLTPRYTITRTDSGGTSLTGPLLGDPALDVNGYVYFYLPIAKETLFPGEDPSAFSTNQIKFTVSVVTEDLAGNSNKLTPTVFPKSGGQFTYQFVRPPVHIAPQDDYSTALDPKSVYQKPLTNYALVFNYPSAPSPRLSYARYIVSNPGSTPIRLFPSVTSSTVQLSEDWVVSIKPAKDYASSWSHPGWQDSVESGQKYRETRPPADPAFDCPKAKYGCHDLYLSEVAFLGHTDVPRPGQFGAPWHNPLNAEVFPCEMLELYNCVVPGYYPSLLTTKPTFTKYPQRKPRVSGKPNTKYYCETLANLEPATPATSNYPFSQQSVFDIIATATVLDPQFETTLLDLNEPGGGLNVPAANTQVSPAKPGQVTLYVVRKSTSRPGNIPAVAAVPPHADNDPIIGGDLWAEWRYDYWTPTLINPTCMNCYPGPNYQIRTPIGDSSVAPVPSGGNGPNVPIPTDPGVSGCPAQNWYWGAYFTMNRATAHLKTAQETASFTIDLKTAAVAPPNKIVGQQGDFSIITGTNFTATYQ